MAPATAPRPLREDPAARRTAAVDSHHGVHRHQGVRHDVVPTGRGARQSVRFSTVTATLTNGPPPGGVGDVDPHATLDSFATSRLAGRPPGIVPINSGSDPASNRKIRFVPGGPETRETDGGRSTTCSTASSQSTYMLPAHLEGVDRRETTSSVGSFYRVRRCTCRQRIRTDSREPAAGSMRHWYVSAAPIRPPR